MSNTGDIRSYTYDELCGLMRDIGEKPFRAGQIFDWLHAKGVSDISMMTNLSKELREKLSMEHDISHLKIIKKLVSDIDGTRKYLHALDDGNVIETVLLKYDYGNSICISSQVGCRMGCRFCASTAEGLVRDLTAGEMAGQIYSVEEDTGEKISHVVVMGSGEPLDNYDNFTRFVDIITDPRGKGLGGRNITASTCGIVPRIRQLADRKYALTLALSLHAVTDEKRKQIMPVASAYPLDEVLDACRYYFNTTGRRITIEYSLISGFNDTLEDAVRLAETASSLKAHVNLIPVNPIKERGYRATGLQGIAQIKNLLEKNRINVTIRREMGRDINGACGQLRRSFITGEENA